MMKKSSPARFVRLAQRFANLSFWLPKQARFSTQYFLVIES
ncbi:protein of unknown function [Xenorhabdus doucetiae]|uniref:Uncharacterized protein n=1 Tax=Xenorhabdus doucetiae TaxID=351671 RepID=A0A068QM09_9GAMM|nr:protein of unknown function [Xenorhabdus doucetiae]